MITQDPLVLEDERVLMIYDGANWSEIDGDYTDCFSIGAICTDETDIYYVYGSESSRPDEYSPPLTLKAQKLSPSL